MYTVPSGRSCPPLPQIDHGGVVYSDLLLSIGVIANFVCEENYSLHGRGRYECSSDNEWIDSNSEIIQQIPTCEGIYIGHLLTSISRFLQTCL